MILFHKMFVSHFMTNKFQLYNLFKTTYSFLEFFLYYQNTEMCKFNLLTYSLACFTFINFSLLEVILLSKDTNYWYCYCVMWMLWSYLKNKKKEINKLFAFFLCKCANCVCKLNWFLGKNCFSMATDEFMENRMKEVQYVLKHYLM